MNWYKFSQTQSLMYHNTAKENAFLIELHGLKINQEWGKTMGAQDDITEIYGVRPIFLSLEPSKFKSKDDVTFQVNVTGLDIVADIPSLYDQKGYYEKGEGMWWKENDVPFELKDLIDENGMIYYRDMLTPGHAVANACIQLTQTAACENSIEPDRLRLIE